MPRQLTALGARVVLQSCIPRLEETFKENKASSDYVDRPFSASQATMSESILLLAIMVVLFILYVQRLGTLVMR
jgi:hypothetical protein